MKSASVELPEDFTGEVRVFPLPQLVMFPSNVQPLHIFESRYREMLEDALHGDRLIALATLEPGYEADYYSRPPIAKNVCLGHVAHHERTEQGTYNIVLVGLWRARIQEEILPVRSFRRARVEMVKEQPAEAAAAVTQQLGRDLTARLATSVPATEKLVDEFSQGNLSLGALTDIMAFHLPFDLKFKLTLLSEADALQRAKMLLAQLPHLPPVESAPPSFQPGFSEN
ncbi:MAG: LON peptidase substrate-binding domain-containing protein [Planctomycetota bacterium]|nr:LON peptidase substrate-binding domain-containing protein [Planctomycetota bacterium]